MIFSNEDKNFSKLYSFFDDPFNKYTSFTPTFMNKNARIAKVLSF